MMYKNYIFDLYGTLVDIHTNETKFQLWKKTADFLACYQIYYHPRHLKMRYLELVRTMEEELCTAAGHGDGEIRLEEVFLRLIVDKITEGQNMADLKIQPDLVYGLASFFRVQSRDYLRLYPGVIELLTGLKTQGAAIYLLSNAQQIFTVPEMEQLGILSYFDGIWISSQKGMKKPCPDFLNSLLVEKKLDPASCVMVGNDESTDVAVAMSCGVDAIYIHSNLSPDYVGQYEGTEEGGSHLFKIMDGDVCKLLELVM